MAAICSAAVMPSWLGALMPASTWPFRPATRTM